MKLGEIAEMLEAEVLYAPENSNDMEFEHVVAADLMSEIMLDTVENSVMVTGLMNTQVIRTAEMMDVNLAVFVRGKEVGSDIIELAKDREVAIIKSSITMYEACGRLYSKGLTPGR